MRIGLVVDHPRRDLEGLVLLARALLARAQAPVLVPMYQQAVDQALLDLDAIVVNYYRPNNAASLRRWRADGLVTFVLDTEGGVLSEGGHDSPEAFAAGLKALNAADGVDGYLFWGDRLARTVAASGALPQERIAATGCPRFDLCAEPWRRRLGARREDYVLINTNFSLINPAQSRGVEAEKATMIAAGWGGDYVRTLIDDAQAVFTAYLACLEQLTAALPECRFRLRPHPFEEKSLYIRRFALRDNVEVNGEGSVAMAIHHAACVLHLNCGSAIETAMLDRLPIQLEFLNTPLQRRHAPLPGRVSRRVNSPRELVDLLARRDGLEEGYDRAAAARELAPYFGPLDGRAGERVADFILRRLGQLPRRRRTSPLGRTLLAQRGLRSMQAVQGALGSLVGTAALARLREGLAPARRGKRLKVEEIVSLVRQLALCEAKPPAHVRRARHPLSGLPLESVVIERPGVLP
jgi:surface carbohydrate biosynthesis protein